jgi:hypothetical protein
VSVVNIEVKKDRISNNEFRSKKTRSTNELLTSQVVNIEVKKDKVEYQIKETRLINNTCTFPAPPGSNYMAFTDIQVSFSFFFLHL